LPIQGHEGIFVFEIGSYRYLCPGWSWPRVYFHLPSNRDYRCMPPYPAYLFAIQIYVQSQIISLYSVTEVNIHFFVWISNLTSLTRPSFHYWTTVVLLL
jgi:hypothetical protein